MPSVLDQSPASWSAGPYTARAERYSSPDYLRLEIERVFRRTWLCAGRLEDIPNKGDHFLFEELGERLFCIRLDGEEVGVYQNACRHRGMPLVEGKGNCKALRCPYHDWKYTLNGELTHIPMQSGFDKSLDKRRLGLRAVRAETWAGFIWITLNPNAPPIRDYLGPIPADLDKYRLEEMRPVKTKVWEQNCNWKAVLDNATETYHVEYVHKRSISPHIDSEMRFTDLGRHHRMTLTIADYKISRWLHRLTAPADISFSDYEAASLYKYVIFPNTLINVLPCHLTVFRVFPIDENRCRFYYHFLGREKANPLARLRVWATQKASKMILDEDLIILNAFQSGHRSRRKQDIYFHVEEAALRHFHEALTGCMEETPPPGTPE